MEETANAPERPTRRVLVLLTMGMAFFWPCVQRLAGYFFSSYSEALIPEPQVAVPASQMPVLQTAFCLCVLVAALLFIAGARHVERVVIRERAFLLTMGLAGFFGCVFLFFDGARSGEPGFGMVAGTLFLAGFFVVHGVAWGIRCVALAPVPLFTVIALSNALGLAVQLVFDVLGLDPVWLLAACPVGSGVALYLVGEPVVVPPEQEASKPAAPQASLMRMLVILCLLFVVLEPALTKLLYAFGSTRSAFSRDVTLLSELVFSVGILVYVRLRGRARTSLASLTLPLFVTLVVAFMCVLLCAQVVGTSSVVPNRLLVGCGWCFSLLLWALVCGLVRSSRFSPVALFSLYLVAVMVISKITGPFIELAYGSIADEQARDAAMAVVPVAVAAALCLVAIVTIVLMGMHIKRQGATPVASLPSVSDEKDPGERQRDICEDLWHDAGLTAKEFDVAVLAARGYSRKAIAAELDISESTVKTHLACVYRKLGVHTRQDLVAMIARSKPLD